MKISNPILFVEINETNYIFSAGVFDESQKLQAKEIIITPNDDIKEGKFFNFSNINLVFKKNIQTIENQLNYVFKEAIVILDSLEYFCTNISGFKKLNGSQILKDNISYILNTLKLAVNESEKDKTIMHMFNSKSVLDGLDIENLPIGLFGDFYSHELTFFLIKNNDLKNLKNIFYKNNLKIKKILLKDFVEGADLIKQNNDTETFLKLKLTKQQQT